MHPQPALPHLLRLADAGRRIMRLRTAYAQLVPELAGLLAGAAVGTVLMFATARYQWARWCEASSAPARDAGAA